MKKFRVIAEFPHVGGKKGMIYRQINNTECVAKFKDGFEVNILLAEILRLPHLFEEVKTWEPKAGDEVWSVFLTEKSIYYIKKFKISSVDELGFCIKFGRTASHRTIHEISRTKKGLIKKLLRNGKLGK